jgi:TusA-related sulfurtransferase
MPVVMARKEIVALDPGQIQKIPATDRVAIEDLQGWAKVAKDMQLLDQETVDENGTHLYIHYVKKGA